MESGLPANVLEELANRLMGSMKSIDWELEIILEKLGLVGIDYDDELVESDLLDYDVELCTSCGWWNECCMLSCDHGVDGVCDQCREGGECPECADEMRGGF